MALAMFVAILSLTFTSCSDDDDNDTSITGTSLVGTWSTGSKADGSILRLTFGSNSKGNLSMIEYDEETGKEIGSISENFEYVYDSNERELVIVGSTLEGRWDIIITASKMTMENYQYRFIFNKQ